MAGGVVLDNFGVPALVLACHLLLTSYACPARRFGVVFGANRQNQDVSKANVGEFGGDIAEAAKKALAGQPKGE